MPAGDSFPPCVRGAINPDNPADHNVGCSGVRLPGGPGCVLRAMPYQTELADGRTYVAQPRLCVLCTIFQVQLAVAAQTKTGASLPASGHLQPFKINPSEWAPEQLMYPKTATTGGMEGLVSPFPAYPATAQLMLDATVSPPSVHKEHRRTPSCTQPLDTSAFLGKHIRQFPPTN